MLIYRLEDKNGTGPYRGKLRSNKIIEEMYLDHSGTVDRYRPPPPSDGIRIESGFLHFFYGFKTEKQLKWWFYGYLTKLKKLGFQIVEIQVPKKHVFFGKHQVAFDSRFAKKKVT